MDKFGAVGVFGRANAGKSTLVNALVRENVSIVSSRPQTTRKRIMGILTTKDGAQLVFCDTPGLHKIKNRLDAFMHTEILATLKGLQAGMYLVDLADMRIEEDKLYLDQMTNDFEFPVILVLNKEDLVDSQTLKKAEQEYAELYNFSSIKTISARKQSNLLELLHELKTIVPEGPHAYDPDYYTSLTEREIVEEVIRQVVLENFRQEVPHSVAVVVEQFKQRPAGKTFIEANLFVEKPSHKPIIVGKAGAGIKNLGKVSRQRLNRLLGRDIFLQLWVKIRENWRRSDEWIQRFGYKKL
jgi:GTP-binding protein Era